MPVDSFVSPAMEWGTENEPITKMAYQLKNKDSGMAEVVFCSTLLMQVHH